MEVKVFTQDKIEVIDVSGCLKMDQIFPFKRACIEHCRKHPTVFLLSNLHFVGSSGIKILFEIFQELEAANLAFKIVGLKADFQRFSLLLNKTIFEVLPSVEVAIQVLKNPEAGLSFKEDPSVYSLHPIVLPTSSVEGEILEESFLADSLLPDNFTPESTETDENTENSLMAE